LPAAATDEQLARGVQAGVAADLARPVERPNGGVAVMLSLQLREGSLCQPPQPCSRTVY
jgi:hypothetical protein